MDCRIIRLPKIGDKRGYLTFLEGPKHIPFEIKRAFFIYGVPRNATRGRHALKNTQEFIIAMAGNFDILVDDGKEKARFHLNIPSEGLFLPSKTWIELNNFSVGSVCLVLASRYYDEKDYIRRRK